MKWTKAQLMHGSQNVTFDENVEIDPSEFSGNSRINSAEDVHVEGSGVYDPESERFYVSLYVEGYMYCPDAISGEEIEIPFEAESEEVYSFSRTDEDGVREVNDDVIELMPAVVDAILLEVPLQMTVLAEDEYPEGDGWKVYSEADYQESRKDQIDPRLAKLKQFDVEE